MDNSSNWSEKVEDLIENGEIDEAISLLQKLSSELQNQSQINSEKLSTALLDLSKLYSTKGLSLLADETRSKAFVIKQQQESVQEYFQEPIFLILDVNAGKESSIAGVSGEHGNHSSLHIDTLQKDDAPDDDWEAIADRAPDELLSPQHLPEVSKLSLQDSKPQGPKRRGRGTFSYKKHGLYSDQQSDEPSIGDDFEDETVSHVPEESSDKKNLNYGTRHILVLADFPLSTKSNDLEKLMEKFKEDVAIRWVNDTTALAVFRTPSLASEASKSVQCPFTVRTLYEEDELLSSIPPRDLEPPRKRPQTSARTAQRLIAQSMGIKLPSTDSGSREFRRQEEARKNRIVSRQHMRSDAWGDDDDAN